MNHPFAAAASFIGRPFSIRSIRASVIIATLIPATLVLATVAAPQLSAQDAEATADPAAMEDPQVDSGNISYFLGVSFGQQLMGNGLGMEDLDNDRLAAGIKDGLAGKEPQMSEEALVQTQQMIQKLLVARMRQMEAKVKKEGEDFLAKIAKEDGVEELAGGLLYKEVTAGSGDSPGATDTVKVHYTGRLVNGNVFDSSVQRGEPATFRVNQVIKGWQMALQEMKVGDKWMLYIPSDLAYGPPGKPPRIAPNSVLMFEVELLEIQ